MSNHSQSVEPDHSRTSELETSTSQRTKHTGKRLGKFQIVGELGRGGMGVVFEARDTVLERNVAIKLLPRSISAQPDVLERFLREARAAAKLNHAHVVAVYDADQVNGQYYIVLELVRGGSLQDSLKTGPLAWIEATQVLADACRGLEAAHRAGLVHRDIKPANLMRSVEGTVKLADFGLVRSNAWSEVTVTSSGNVLGTPQYMSPEQCRSEQADSRSDLYSMGATYFALLTGQPPYPGEAPLLVMNSHLLDPIPDPRDIDPTIPEACCNIIRCAMAKDPDDRYSSATTLLLELETILAATKQAGGIVPPVGSLSSKRSQETIVTAKHRSRSTPTAAKRTLTRQFWRPWRVASVALVILAVVMVGWWLLIPPSDTHPRIAKNPRDSNIPQADDGRAKLAPKSAIDLPAGSFHLPGLKWEQHPGDSRHNVWSMDYPNISRVYLANSGEFLAVLTNGPLRQKNGSWQSQVTVWNRNGKQVLVEVMRGRALCGAISGNSRLLAVGTTGGQGVLLWDTKTWKRERSPAPQVPESVHALALSDDGRWLAYTVTKSSKTGEWVLWDVSSQQESRRQTVNGSGTMRAIEFASGDELRVVTGGDDGLVRHWRGTQAELLPQSLNTRQPIYAIACRPGQPLQATGFGKSLSLWDYQRNIQNRVADQLPVQVDDVVFSPNGRHVCVSAGAMVEIMDADTGQVVDTLTSFGARVLSMAYTPDGTGLFAASANGKLRLWREIHETARGKF